jgi:hypothetical protein
VCVCVCSQVLQRPDDARLALLLGIAIGVMASLSVLEMFLHNAMQHGFLGVTVSVVLGAAAFFFANPYFPEFDVSNIHGVEQVSRRDAHLPSPLHLTPAHWSTLPTRPTRPPWQSSQSSDDGSRSPSGKVPTNRGDEEKGKQPMPPIEEAESAVTADLSAACDMPMLHATMQSHSSLLCGGERFYLRAMLTCFGMS